MKKVIPGKPNTRQYVSIERTSDGYYFLYFSNQNGKPNASVIITEGEANNISQSLGIIIRDDIP